MNDKIVKEHQFNHPMSKVWEAISKAEEISAWFIQADFKAEEGYDYTFKHEDEDHCTTINGKVLQVNPISHLVYTWIVEGTNVETTVSWKLTEKDGGTHLTLEHTGISKYPGESAVKMFESFSGGWDNCNAELDKYLATVNA